MSRNNIGENRVSILKTVMPSLTNDAEFFLGIPKTWGLSFQINTERTPTGLPAGSLMWAGLCNSYYWIDPLNGIGGVYMTQIFPFADEKSCISPLRKSSMRPIKSAIPSQKGQTDGLLVNSRTPIYDDILEVKFRFFLEEVHFCSFRPELTDQARLFQLAHFPT
jgi:CubicO group peptidase (beta-lactamase class C family)